MFDLSETAGFPLWFDPDRLEIRSGGNLVFSKETRRYQDMQDVIAGSLDYAPTQAVYWNYKLENAGEYASLLDPLHLTLGLVMLPALKIGCEYVKTHGHYHAAMTGSNFSYPEVYTLYSGTLFLYLQRRSHHDCHALDDCVLYAMRPGGSITIPPGYAHILINPSDRPALMAGLYCLDSVHEYGMINETRGGGYYFIEREGNFTAIPNSRYQNLPALRRIDLLSGTPFFPPDSEQPLWSSFITDPDRYRFLASPADAARQFQPEDLKI